MLLVQQYLSGKSLSDLARDHGVYAKINGHKFSLNYDQIEAAEGDKLAQECRGLVLGHSHSNLTMDTIVGQTNIFAYPFNRFFNYGQDAAAKIDFENDNHLFFYEKLDGTCIIVYFDGIKNEWCVATRSLPEANVPLDGFTEFTFTTLFHETIKKVTNLSFKDWTSFLHTGFTYVFELTTPLNKIVVQYDDYNIHLLGIRNNNTLEECPIEQAGSIGMKIPLCPSYKLNSLTDMLAFVANRNPLKHEGIIVCSRRNKYNPTGFVRNKIKNSEYMAYTRIKDSMANSPRALMQIVLSGKLDDLFVVMPEHLKPIALQYQEGIQKLIKDFNKDYSEVVKEVKAMGIMSEKVTRKQFVVCAQARKSMLSPMMSMYDKKVNSIQEYFESQKEPSTGDYKKSLLEFLISKV